MNHYEFRSKRGRQSFLAYLRKGQDTMKEERKILLEREYDTEAHFLGMHYLRDPKTKAAFYETEASSSEFPEDLEEVYGIYCLKCGTLHEYSKKEYAKATKDYRKIGGDVTLKTKTNKQRCKCCKEIPMKRIVSVNGSASSRRLQRESVWQSVPKAITIAEKGERINISVICRNWGFNAKAEKPYLRDFQVTVVINTALGQTYIMPAKWANKPVFVDNECIRTASLFNNEFLNFINDAFFKDDDGMLMSVLTKALKAARPEIKGEIKDLVSLARANFLGELYELSPEAGEGRLYYDTAATWITLKRRYKKDPSTFHKYLTHGCKAVATKSIRRILYKYPEQKWTLRFLYKFLGITDPNILRTLLEDRNGCAASTADYFQSILVGPGRRASERQIRHLSDALSEAGLTDKQKAAFLLSDDIRIHNLCDGARMYEMYEDSVSTEELLRFKSVEELHDHLADLNIKLKDRARWDRYHEEISYDEDILALEGQIDNADFRIIKSPWDLRDLGRRFHNCVGTYMEDVKQRRSIIVEMLLNGKPAACIELDGDGDVCSQAFSQCNQRLEGDAAEKFNAWTKKHHITIGGLASRVARAVAPDFEYEVLPF